MRGPPVEKSCEQCGKTYLCERHRMDKSRFCGIGCANEAQKLPRNKYTCQHCGVNFTALPDHGNPRKFCSRECFTANALPPIEKECKNCGGLFTAVRATSTETYDGYRIYCSKKCSDTDKLYEDRPCAVCGTMFYPNSKRKNETQLTCSNKCRAEYFSGVNSHMFVDGTYIAEQTNHKMVLQKRPGYVGKYMAEHRLVVSKYLGRLLTRSEYIIHINNRGTDNRLENLFICESNSEFSRRRNGSLPWPEKSNLGTYKKTQSTQRKSK